MSTLVDEQHGAPEHEQVGGEQPANGSGGPAGASADAHATHPCPNCGCPMEPGQEWCLQCGAAAPGALERAPWRSTGLIVGVIVALALGAAAAAVAALDQHAPARRTVTSIVASAPATTPPPATTTPATTPPPASVKAAPLPSTPAKLPKIPTTASTTPVPSSTGTSTTGTGTGTSGASQGSSGTGGGSGSSGEGSGGSQPSALLLDTDAATTYNPYDLPASYFGDPSLTIDGDNTTSWTAQINPATEPSMAEGVLLNLKSLKKLSALELVSTSKGMVVQVYGTTEKKPPASITEAAWVPLTQPVAIKKTHTRFKLLKPKDGFRYVVVWISKAPASAIGTPTAPGHVKVGEIELFPAS